MLVFQGKSVFSGVAIAKVHLITKQANLLDSSTAENPQTEWERFLSAAAEADKQLADIYEKTKAEIGEEEAEIIDVQRLMLEDEDFIGEIESLIKEDHCNAAYAASKCGKEKAAFFLSLDDPYMKARSTDITDISQRLADILLGTRTNLQFEEPVILVAEDLTPSETLQMDKTKIKAFVTRRGAANSHTAILARIMNIPCIVQADIPLTPSITGKTMIVDGEEGICYLEPDQEIYTKMKEKREKSLALRKVLDSMRGLPTVTKSGRPVRLYSNIGNIDDLNAVLEHDAEGIGLFRSEFLYLGRQDYPTEEELFEVYRKVAEGMGGKPVIIRTLDIGADKKVDYFGLEEEENPALGLRGIRICIDRPELFKIQLRAIYRASAFGRISVMFPMIASLWEVRRCKELAAEVRSELTEEGIFIGEAELGIMIETPASVMIADTLAKEVDFFSVGTNDLTQYALAIDRQSTKLEQFYDPHHPAVLKMLEMTAEAAATHNIWAGICGELAADPQMTQCLVDMGYSELSVSPVYTLEMRKRIREMN